MTRCPPGGTVCRASSTYLLRSAGLVRKWKTARSCQTSKACGGCHFVASAAIHCTEAASLPRRALALCSAAVTSQNIPRADGRIPLVLLLMAVVFIPVALRRRAPTTAFGALVILGVVVIPSPATTGGTIHIQRIQQGQDLAEYCRTQAMPHYTARLDGPSRFGLSTPRTLTSLREPPGNHLMAVLRDPELFEQHGPGARREEGRR